MDDSLNLPLEHLREMSRELDREKPYVVYSDSARRARAGAFLLNELGLTAYVLGGGLRANPDLGHRRTLADPAPAQPHRDASRDHLSKLLAEADLEVALAFQDKLEATTARRLWEDEVNPDPDKKTGARLEAKQKKLELESQTASHALGQAQRKKLEAESRLRSAEAQAERRRAEAEIACETLRIRADSLLKNEETRLQDHYTVAAAKLNELKQERSLTEERLRKERARIEKELNESHRTLRIEARKIKDDLQRKKLEAEDKADQIRSKEAAAETRLRGETEAALRTERRKLEAQFALSVSELEKAEHKLEAAQQAKLGADKESKRVVAAMREAEETRRDEAEATRLAVQQKLVLEAQHAKECVLDAWQAKEAAEGKRRAVMQKLARMRAATDDGNHQREETGHESNLRDEIDRIDANVSDAIGKLELAQRAKASADANSIAGEEKAARQRESEQELRLKLHEEAEEWLKHERERSQTELEKAQLDLAQKWALREVSDQQRRELEVSSENLLDDIRAQLSRTDDSLEAVGDKAYAAQRTELALAAQENLAQEKIQTQATLDDARVQIARLKQQGLLD